MRAAVVSNAKQTAIAFAIVVSTQCRLWEWRDDYTQLYKTI